jgi:hypothetical protein
MFIVIVFQQFTKAHVGRTLKQSCSRPLQDYTYSAPWFCAKRCTTVYTNFDAATRRLMGVVLLLFEILKEYAIIYNQSLKHAGKSDHPQLTIKNKLKR